MPKPNIRFLYKIASTFYGFLAKILSPIYQLQALRYTFVITTSCSFKCSFCHVRTGLNQKKNDYLEIEEWFKVANSVPPYSIVSLTGGEPFNSKNTIPLITRLKSKKIKVSVVSNGGMLTNDKLDLLDQVKLDYLMFSLDGTQDYHDKSRGVPNSFKHIISMLSYLDTKKSSIKVGAKVILNYDNSEEMIPLLKILENYKCIFDITIGLRFENTVNGGLINLDSLTHPSFQQGNTYQYPSHSVEKIKNTVKEIIEYKTTSRKIINFTPSLKTVNDIMNYIENPKLYGVKKCYLPWIETTIHPNGEISPCVSFNTGNIRDYNYDLNKASKTLHMKEFRDHLNKTTFPKFCEGCCTANIHNKK